MKMNFTFSTCLLATLLFSMASCKKEARNEISDQEHCVNTANEARMLDSELLKSVRNATSRFHSTTAAIKAGYQADHNCVSVPGLGGMGYHWLNLPLVDPVFDPIHPEVVLYAPGPGGKLRMVAVEYIVVNVGQPVPMFGNQVFTAGGTPLPVPHWSLHVWLYEENPSGMFVPFNPNISCP